MNTNTTQSLTATQRYEQSLRDIEFSGFRVSSFNSYYPYKDLVSFIDSAGKVGENEKWTPHQTVNMYRYFKKL